MQERRNLDKLKGGTSEVQERQNAKSCIRDGVTGGVKEPGTARRKGQEGP